MNYRPYLVVLSVILSYFLLVQISCSKEEIDPNAPVVELADLPYDKLSDYNFFTGNIADQNPQPSVLPYDLNTALFSNYSSKARFIWMPEGKTTAYNPDRELDFPVGTVIIKTFYYDNDFNDPSAGRQLLETRLLIRQDTAWQFASYLWNDEQTEADFSVVGKQVEVTWKHYDGSDRSTLYLIPNKNECKGCHNSDNVIHPIGPKIRNINKDFAYADGTMNQLDKWKSMGYLADFPTDAPRVPAYDNPLDGTLEERARAYIDVNCAHCHNPRSPANTTGLFLNYDETDPTRLGICKQPVAAGQGSGGFEYGIVPGDADNSIMTYRMNSVEPDVAMPELLRSVVDVEGVELIRDWINAMPPDDCM